MVLGGPWPPPQGTQFLPERSFFCQQTRIPLAPGGRGRWRGVGGAHSRKGSPVSCGTGVCLLVSKFGGGSGTPHAHEAQSASVDTAFSEHAPIGRSGRIGLYTVSFHACLKCAPEHTLTRGHSGGCDQPAGRILMQGDWLRFLFWGRVG